jgi:hypothetical protein
MLSFLTALASAAAVQAGDAASPSADPYDAVMNAQYAAYSDPIPQRPEEAQRIYDAYLNAIGQKAKPKSENSSASAEDQPR